MEHQSEIIYRHFFVITCLEIVYDIYAKGIGTGQNEFFSIRSDPQVPVSEYIIL